MNTSSEAGNSSEEKISIIITCGLVVWKWHIIQLFITTLGFLFILLPAVFLLLLVVRAFEADRSTRLNFSLIEVNWSVTKQSKVTGAGADRTVITNRYAAFLASCACVFRGSHMWLSRFGRRETRSRKRRTAVWKAGLFGLSRRSTSL